MMVGLPRNGRNLSCSATAISFAEHRVTAAQEFQPDSRGATQALIRFVAENMPTQVDFILVSEPKQNCFPFRHIVRLVANGVPPW